MCKFLLEALSAIRNIARNMIPVECFIIKNFEFFIFMIVIVQNFLNILNL